VWTLVNMVMHVTVPYVATPGLAEEPSTSQGGPSTLEVVSGMLLD